nr:MAG TPA: internal virion protein C [Caudoviricetes sp.]
MAYKNSNGTSSISNEWGQWRYFNSALKKLGDSSPAQVSITPKEPIVEAEINWMSVAGDVIKGAMGVFEERQKLSYSLADDYLKKHSIEEYQAAMKNGSIPFQDDPIAMQRLKYDHGKLVFQLSEQDFAERVNKGEFVGMPPEKVDALHYEHSKKAMKEVSDVFGYADGNDYWFNEGFFADSENGRIKNLLRNSEVTNDRLVQQRLTNDIAKTIALINSGNLTPDSFKNIIADTLRENGYRYTPEDLSVYSNTVLKALGDSPNGDRLLEIVKDAEVPGTGITFSDYIGSAGIETIKRTSQNLRFNMNARDMYEFKSSVDKMALDGDVSGLTTRLNRELYNNGNTKTDRTEYLFKSIDNAHKAQEKAMAVAGKKIVFDKASTDWATYLMDCVDGKPVEESIEDKKLKYDGTGFNTKHMDVVAQNVVAKIFSEVQEHPERLKNLMAYSANKSNTYPALKNAIARAVSDSVSQFEPFVEEWINKGTLDPKKGFKTSDYGGIKNVPEPLKALMGMYDLNPSAFERLAGDKAVDYVKTSKMAISLGRNPMAVIGNSKRLLAEYKREARSQGSPVTVPSLGRYSLYGSKDPLNIDANNQLDILALSLAEEYKKKDPEATYKDALEAGKEVVKQSYYQVGNTPVPRVYLEESFGNLTAKEENMVDIGWCADKSFRDLMKSKNITDFSMSFFDAQERAIVIVGVDGVSKGKLPISELSKLTKDEYVKDLKKYWFQKIGRE